MLGYTPSDIVKENLSLIGNSFLKPDLVTLRNYSPRAFTSTLVRVLNLFE